MAVRAGGLPRTAERVSVCLADVAVARAALAARRTPLVLRGTAGHSAEGVGAVTGQAGRAQIVDARFAVGERPHAVPGGRAIGDLPHADEPGATASRARETGLAFCSTRGRRGHAARMIATRTGDASRSCATRRRERRGRTARARRDARRGAGTTARAFDAPAAHTLVVREAEETVRRARGADHRAVAVDRAVAVTAIVDGGARLVERRARGAFRRPSPRPAPASRTGESADSRRRRARRAAIEIRSSS